MPGTFVIDQESTFSTALLMSTDAKPRFGDPTGAQEVSAAGVPKWLAQVAVTFTSDNGMAPVSEVLTVTVTSRTNPAEGISPGSTVVFDGLRVGVSPPEKRDNGTIRGGRLWYSATGLRPALALTRTGKSDA